MNNPQLKSFAQQSFYLLYDSIKNETEKYLNGVYSDLEITTPLAKKVSTETLEKFTIEQANWWFIRFATLRFLELAECINVRQNFHQHQRKTNQPKKLLFDELSLICEQYPFFSYLYQLNNKYEIAILSDSLLTESELLNSFETQLTKETFNNPATIGYLFELFNEIPQEQLLSNIRKSQLKVETKNIAAATQFFTPPWISQYLAENSIARLWLENYPQSKITDNLHYYVKSELNITHDKHLLPEEITVCDPACGAGHLLITSYHILKKIYIENGYTNNEIAKSIIQFNLYGFEIAALPAAIARFSLSMTAFLDSRDKSVFSINPNITLLNSFHVDYQDHEKAQMGNDYLSLALDHFAKENNYPPKLQKLINTINDICVFGSLVPNEDIIESNNTLDELLSDINIFDYYFRPLYNKISQFLQHIHPLINKYEIVIANPPYLGNRHLNKRLSNYLNLKYKDFNKDLFSAFIYRCSTLSKSKGKVGIMCPNVWLYLPTFKKVRNMLINKKTITSLIELPLSGYRNATVHICCFSFMNEHIKDYWTTYIDLNKFRSAKTPLKIIASSAIQDSSSPHVFKRKTDTFLKINGNPITYRLTPKILETFNQPLLGDKIPSAVGLQTGDTKQFIRYWWEVSRDNICFAASDSLSSKKSKKKWFPIYKGGTFRKWYGNLLHVVDWENDGEKIRNFKDKNGRLKSRAQNINYYFKEMITWSNVTVGETSFRYSPGGAIFDTVSHSAFPDNIGETSKILGYLNTNYCKIIISSLNPTLHFSVGDFSNIPYPEKLHDINFTSNVERCIEISKEDWDSHELSLDFHMHPLLDKRFKTETIEQSYYNLREYWINITEEMRQLEIEMNKHFNSLYYFNDEISHNISYKKISLRCNPAFRFCRNKHSKTYIESLFFEEIIQEFVSFVIGTIFGRYNLKECNSVQKQEFSKKLDPSVLFFTKDIVFKDDLYSHFISYLKLMFPNSNPLENINFIEKGLSATYNSTIKLENYFLYYFFQNHSKFYLKKPIYWLFSSPSKIFNALLYIHNYSDSTIKQICSYLENCILYTQDIHDYVSTKELKKYHASLSRFAENPPTLFYDNGVSENYAIFQNLLRPIK